MDWTNVNVMKFLELYQMHPCIWDPKNSSHKNKKKLNDAWVDIQKNMGEPCTIADLKKKRESLMSAFRGYRTKIKKSETSGAGTSNIYQPTWFAYEFMNSFLGAIYKCNPSVNTEVTQNEQEMDNLNSSQDDTDNAITLGETNVSNSEEERPSHTSHVSSGNQGSLSSEQTPRMITSKRRQHNPPELQQAKKQMDEAFNILKSIAQPTYHDDEDECSIFGRLVAKKMRTLTEERRDLMMIKINQLFYDERQEYNRSNSSKSMASYTFTPSPLTTIENEDNVAQVITVVDGEMVGSNLQHTFSPLSRTENEDNTSEVVTFVDAEVPGPSFQRTPSPLPRIQKENNIPQVLTLNPTRIQQSNNLTNVYKTTSKELSQFLLFRPNQNN